MTVFIVIFSVVVLVIVDIYGQEHPKFQCYCTVSFIIGSFTSILCGYIGMRIAVAANYRTTFKTTSSLAEGFQTAFKAGCVMGFSQVALALSILMSLIIIYIKVYNPVFKVGSENSISTLAELVAGYGLGGSSMALFGRVGGGIFTKAADVGADLVGKLGLGLPEDSADNPATIADNVGDNVGDIAGMGSDLFGSFAEATCAALVVMCNTPDLVAHQEALLFPLLISAIGIIACFFTSIYGLYFYKVDSVEKIESSLMLQLTISTFLVLVGLVVLGKLCLPATWTFDGMQCKWWHAVLTTAMGLISGLIIGFATNFFTSNHYRPVQEMTERTGKGTSILVINGLALGYLSTIIPIFLLALTSLIGIKFLGMLGVALAAIGMLSTLSVGLAIDAYGPVCDNAGGIAEMSEIGHEIRELTDALDAAGNTTAAIGKGFAIGSAALVALALYGAFITRAKKAVHNPIYSIEINDPWIFCSLLIGAMLPYAFSAMTMKSVGESAHQMMEEIKRQYQDEDIRNKKKKPDYQACIQVATESSLKEMVSPGLLVIATPILLGVFFHPILVAGLLPGSLLSGIQLAISMSNTGGAWDNCKKLIETGNFKDINGKLLKKGGEEHKSSVIGDTIGDPMKDTSGPSLNILVKLMAIISLVFAGGFSQTSFLADILQINSK